MHGNKKNREILEEIDLIVMDDVKKENIFIYIIRIIKEFFLTVNKIKGKVWKQNVC